MPSRRSFLRHAMQVVAAAAVAPVAPEVAMRVFERPKQLSRGIGISPAGLLDQVPLFWHDDQVAEFFATEPQRKLAKLIESTPVLPGEMVIVQKWHQAKSRLHQFHTYAELYRYNPED